MLKAAGIKRPDGTLRLPAVWIEMDVSGLSGTAPRIIYLQLGVLRHGPCGAAGARSPCRSARFA